MPTSGDKLAYLRATLTVVIHETNFHWRSLLLFSNSRISPWIQLHPLDNGSEKGNFFLSCTYAFGVYLSRLEICDLSSVTWVLPSLSSSYISVINVSNLYRLQSSQCNIQTFKYRIAEPVSKRYARLVHFPQRLFYFPQRHLYSPNQSLECFSCPRTIQCLFSSCLTGVSV